MRALVLAVLLVVACSPAATPAPTARPTRPPVSPELAVQFALETLHTDSPVGYLVGAPTTIRGRVIPLGDAYMLVNGRAPGATSPLARRPDRSVWLIVTRGEWLLHIPGGHGDPRQRTPTVMSHDITVPDLWNALLFDAASGATLDVGGVPESQRPALEMLPLLPAP